MTNAEKTRDVDEIAAWLTRKLSKELRVDPDRIEPGTHFTSLGMDSMTAVALVGDLEDWLGQSLPDALLWEHTNVRTLTEHLARLVALAQIREDVSRGVCAPHDHVLALLDEGHFEEALAVIEDNLRGGEQDRDVVAAVLEAWGDAEPDRAQRRILYDRALSEIDRGMGDAGQGVWSRALVVRRERVLQKCSWLAARTDG